MQSQLRYNSSSRCTRVCANGGGRESPDHVETTSQHDDRCWQKSARKEGKVLVDDVEILRHMKAALMPFPRTRGHQDM